MRPTVSGKKEKYFDSYGQYGWMICQFENSDVPQFCQELAGFLAGLLPVWQEAVVAVWFFFKIGMYPLVHDFLHEMNHEKYVYPIYRHTQIVVVVG